MATEKDDRWRGTLDEARRVLALPSNAVTHLLDNGDGTYSISAHIVCEDCNYCGVQEDCRDRPDCEPTPIEAEPWSDEEEAEASRHPLIQPPALESPR